ncbi:hypothetical protein pclt_cds_860 [Pandoravirus celtis]|uniref:Uncharacterized protein n=1 Tax=Pandoravirus celtis TaxID=2568002 RepID=A0A4D6EIB4_9VIRU|nr:hypothetical protein pclt_cds_860 [Pandoravirus celtis]
MHCWDRRWVTTSLATKIRNAATGIPNVLRQLSPFDCWAGRCPAPVGTRVSPVNVNVRHAKALADNICMSAGGCGPVILVKIHFAHLPAAPKRKPCRSPEHWAPLSRPPPTPRV